MSLLARAIVGIALLSGCAGGAPLEPVKRLTYNPNDWTDEERAALVSAADRWNDLAGPVVELVAVPDGAGVAIAPADLPGAVAGRSSAGSLRIDNAWRGPHVERVALHEIGHVLGLGHVERGIMQPDTLYSSLEWSPADIEECVRVGVCMIHESH